MFWETYYYYCAQNEVNWRMTYEIFISAYNQATKRFKKKKSVWCETIRLLRIKKDKLNFKKHVTANMKLTNELTKDITDLKEKIKEKEKKIPKSLSK